MMKKKNIFLVATIMALFSICANGQNAKKYSKAGEEFIKSMKYDDAIEQFTNAIDLEPSNADFYYASEKL